MAKYRGKGRRGDTYGENYFGHKYRQGKAYCKACKYFKFEYYCDYYDGVAFYPTKKNKSCEGFVVDWETQYGKKLKQKNTDCSGCENLSMKGKKVRCEVASKKIAHINKAKYGHVKIPKWCPENMGGNQ